MLNTNSLLHFLNSCPFPRFTTSSVRRLYSRDTSSVRTVIHPESGMGQACSRHEVPTDRSVTLHPTNRNPHHAIWGHSVPRLVRITQPRTPMMSPSLSSPQHHDRGNQMEAIWTQKTSQSPADIIKGGQLDSRLIYLLARSDSASCLWMCTLKTRRDLCWCSSHPSVVLWSFLQSLCDWSASKRRWWVWWCDDEEDCVALFRSVMTAFIQRVCVLREHTVCVCMFEMVYIGFSLGSLHLVRC